MVDIENTWISRKKSSKVVLFLYLIDINVKLPNYERQRVDDGENEIVHCQIGVL